MRHIPHSGPRVETGAVQFGDDWPGLFIRGDNAAYLSMQIRSVAMLLEKQPEAWFCLTELKSIADIIDNNVILNPKDQPHAT